MISSSDNVVFPSEIQEYTSLPNISFIYSPPELISPPSVSIIFFNFLSRSDMSPTIHFSNVSYSLSISLSLLIPSLNIHFGDSPRRYMFAVTDANSDCIERFPNSSKGGVDQDIGIPNPIIDIRNSATYMRYWYIS